jgi:hypothetical protein
LNRKNTVALVAKKAVVYVDSRFLDFDGNLLLMRKDKAGFFALIFGALLFWTWKSDAPKEKIDAKVSEIPEVIGTSIQAKPIEMDTMVKIMAEQLRITTLKVDQEIAYRDTVIPPTEPFPLSRDF